MRRKTVLLNLLILVSLLLTGALAVAAAEPPASAPTSSAPPALLSTLAAAQPAPCSAPTTAAERAIFSPNPEDLAGSRNLCGACSGVCANVSKGTRCWLGLSAGLCTISAEVCTEDGRTQCVCGAP
jgi:hypothetical protein